MFTIVDAIILGNPEAIEKIEGGVRNYLGDSQNIPSLPSFSTVEDYISYLAEMEPDVVIIDYESLCSECSEEIAIVLIRAAIDLFSETDAGIILIADPSVVHSKLNGLARYIYRTICLEELRDTLREWIALPLCSFRSP